MGLKQDTLNWLAAEFDAKIVERGKEIWAHIPVGTEGNFVALFRQTGLGAAMWMLNAHLFDARGRKVRTLEKSSIAIGFVEGDEETIAKFKANIKGVK